MATAEYLPLPHDGRVGLGSDGTEWKEREARAGAGPGTLRWPPHLARPPQGKSGNWPHFGHLSQPRSFSPMP